MNRLLRLQRMAAQLMIVALCASTLSIPATTPLAQASAPGAHAPRTLNLLTSQNCPGPTTGQVSCWPAEGNASDAWDGNTGTLQNGATFAPGLVGQAFSFDGVNDYVLVPDASNLDLATDWTINVWIYQTAQQPDYDVVVGKGRGFAGTGYAVGIGNGRAGVGLNKSGSNCTATDSQVLPLGQWNYIAVTFSSSTVRVYVNGQLRATQTCAFAALDPSTEPLNIGREVNGLTGREFAGLADEVELFSRALSLAEVQATYAAGLNKAPVAANDSYSTAGNTPLLIDPPGVLANDTDADADDLTAIKVSDPTHGSVGFNADGSFAYTPATGYSGPDSFTYKANDGLLDSAIATVHITVTNTAPVAVNDSYSTTRNAPLFIDPPGVLGNDSDAEGNPLTATAVSQPTHGALLLTPDGAFNYIPDDGFIGSDSFSYQASDGAAVSNSATVTIEVRADTGLLGYWQFDDGSGTVAVDRSGSVPPNNGVLSTGASFSTAAAPITSFANPGSLSLTGATTSTVSVPNSAINRLTNGFSVMGWIRASSLSSYQRVIGTARTTSNNGWSFGLVNTSVLFSTVGKKDYSAPSLALKTNQWYHIAAVMDTSNTVSFYINGQLIGSVTGSAPATADPDDILLIGAGTASGGSTPTELFKGQIDDLRVYNRVLSGAEVAAATGITSCSESVLRAKILLGDRAGTIALDGACTYSLTFSETSGNGLVIASATTLEGNGATIERGPSAPAFRILNANAATPALTIRNLTLRGGSTTGNGAGLNSSRDLTLSNVRFENNAAGTGGALAATKSLSLDRGVFLGNQSTYNGGAIYLTGPSGRVTNSVFGNNNSGGAGAALQSGDRANLTLLNNTFTDQYKNPDEAVLINGLATVQNNIFENFKVPLTASGLAAVASEDYNLLASNEAEPRALSGATLTRGGHDRSAITARFVNAAARNYRLQQNSPALDLGTDAGVTSDADGNQRPFIGGAIDIGAYEYQGAGVPSISVVKTGSPYAAATGQTQFLLTVINESTTVQNDLQLVEQLPAGATLVAGSISGGGSLSGSTLTWNLPPLAPNQRQRVGYRVTAAQDLISNQYRVSSISNPALTDSGPTLTTPYTTTVTALGFFPFSDGYGFANYGDGNDSDVTVEDIASIFGADKVCKTQNPCVLTASAEAYRQSMVASNGGHCFGMAMASLWIYDRADIAPGDYQPGADITYDLLKSVARKLIQRFFTTQVQSPVSTSVPAFTAAKGIEASLNLLKTNFADPSASDRYTISFWKPDGSDGHAVTPFAIKQIDADHYWIYVYDNNYPNNFDRVFKAAHENNTWSWIYEGGATNPTAPPSTYTGDDSVIGQEDHRVRFQLKSLRNSESFPKKCTSACAPGPFSKTTPISGTTLTQSTSAALSWQASEGVTSYDYCYDTTNDNTCSNWRTTKSLSATVSNLTPNTAYYWQVRAYNGSYTYADGRNTAFWSFKTAATTTLANMLAGPLPSSAARVGAQSSVAVAADDPPAAPVSSYDFQLEGEGYLLITRSDGKRAGFDPSGLFIAEIPGAQEIDYTTGLGLNIPNILRIPHEPGMTYRISISDRLNAYGNLAAPADLTITGPGLVARLKGLKIDSPEDTEAPQGTNDVLGVSFDADNLRLGFTASTLDSDTPALSLALSQGGAADYTFEVSGAVMPSGRSLSVRLDPTTGLVVIENDDPADNSYSLDVERINLDGSKTSYHFDSLSDGTGVGAVIDLGPGWTGGAPSVGQNTVPVATADSYTTNADSVLEVGTPGLLGNDSGAVLTAVLVAGPAHGSLTLNPDGSFSYTPASGYAGGDSFTYRATSGLYASNVATVSITVNAAPVAADDTYSTFANTTLTVSAPGLLGNDSDAEGSPLTAVLVGGPSHGSLTLNPNGSFSYTPASGYVGGDSFTYQASDGAAVSNVATVSITVRYNFAGFFQPVDNPPALNEVHAGQSIPMKFGLGGDFGLAIIATGYPVSQPVNCASGAPLGPTQTTTASVALSYDASSGRYTYTWKTESSWAGTCRRFTLRLTDGTDHTALFQFR